VGIQVDAEDAAVIQRLLVPAPVKIKAPRMRIDFNGDAVPGASLQDLIVVDLVYSI
jgi:hypothetical protein